MASQSKLYYTEFRPHITFHLYHDGYEQHLIVPLRNILKNNNVPFLLGEKGVEYVVIKFISERHNNRYAKIYLRRSDVYVTTFGNVTIEGNAGARYSFKLIDDIPFSSKLSFDERYCSLGDLQDSNLSFEIFQNAVCDLIEELNRLNPNERNFKIPLHIIIVCLAEGARFSLISKRLHQTDHGHIGRKYQLDFFLFDEWMELFTKNWRKISLHALLWESYYISSNYVVFRYMYPISRLESVMGRAAKTVQEMRRFSNSFIQIGEVIADCPFVVITLHSRNDRTQDATEISGGNVRFICPAVVSLFKVHDTVVDYDISYRNDVEAPVHKACLLVPDDRISHLTGTNMEFIHRVQRLTGTTFAIKNNNKPDCALADDVVLQVQGRADKVTDALFLIAQRSLLKPSHKQTSFSSRSSLGVKQNTTITEEQKMFLAGRKIDDYTYREHLDVVIESPFLCKHFLKVQWNHQGLIKVKRKIK